MLDFNGITGPSATKSGRTLWHVFTRNPTRYVGSVIATRSGVFRCMDKLSPRGNSTGITATDIINGCQDEDGNDWIKAYRDSMGDSMIVPASFLKDITAKQSFLRWAKTIA